MRGDSNSDLAFCTGFVEQVESACFSENPVEFHGEGVDVTFEDTSPRAFDPGLRRAVSWAYPRAIEGIKVVMPVRCDAVA